MLYIITALKPEAQAFIDKYRPVKGRCKNFLVYEGEFFRLLISGKGVVNMKKSVYALLEEYAPTKEDILINVGICAADKRHEIGGILKIGKVVYGAKECILDADTRNIISCKDEEAVFADTEIADMESFGFCETTCGFKNRYMYKVVSDHFEPDKVTKEGTKMLIFNKIDDILKEIPTI